MKIRTVLMQGFLWGFFKSEAYMRWQMNILVSITGLAGNSEKQVSKSEVV